MSDKRASLPVDKAELVLARKVAGMRNPSITIGENAEIFSNSQIDEMKMQPIYKVVVRKAGRSGPAEISGRAKSLKKCKGLKGCEFAKCAKEAFGKLPKNLEKSCPTL